MRIVVFGAGGVGGYFGGRLSQAGNDVLFVARGKQLEALRQNGITIESPLGFHAGPVQVTEDATAAGRADLVLIATKAWQVREAGKAIAPIVNDTTSVLPLQNGVEAPRELSDILGHDRVLGGLCRILSHIAEPGKIVHVGADPTIVIGELDNQRSDRVGTINDVLNTAHGMQAEVAENIEIALWRKFLLMAPISGLSAATRAPMGIIRSTPETRALLSDAMHEVVSLANAMGIAVPRDAVDTTLAFIDTLPRESVPSMSRDITDGKPSELEAQTGAVARLGAEHGVSVPVNRFLYHTLLPLERRARGLVEF